MPPVCVLPATVPSPPVTCSPHLPTHPWNIFPRRLGPCFETGLLSFPAWILEVATPHTWLMNRSESGSSYPGRFRRPSWPLPRAPLRKSRAMLAPDTRRAPGPGAVVTTACPRGPAPCHHLAPTSSFDTRCRQIPRRRDAGPVRSLWRHNDRNPHVKTMSSTLFAEWGPLQE